MFIYIVLTFIKTISLKIQLRN